MRMLGGGVIVLKDADGVAGVVGDDIGEVGLVIVELALVMEGIDIGEI